MKQCAFYIDGVWQKALNGGSYQHPNPADETLVAYVPMAGIEEANHAVKAAVRAFETYSQTDFAYRRGLLEKLQATFERHYAAMATAISHEMGAPWDLAYNSQAECGPGHIKATLAAANEYPFFSRSGEHGDLWQHPIGVCVLITPWNWPLNQIMSKLAPALLAGCTVVLKPSEFAPLSAQLVAECVHEAGYPAGVFNMIFGEGALVGHALSSHPDVAMVSFTGSTAAGISVAKTAADTVKRVVQELGGKSPHIVLADAPLKDAITFGVSKCFSNTGQSCNAPTRMLVEASVYKEAVTLAATYGATVRVISPNEQGDGIGPLAMKRQFDTVQRYIRLGIDEGARLILGGEGRPEGFDKGYFVRPTIFADVNNSMRIAREEIFGPVLCMIPFKDEAEAIHIANDTPFGLAAYISSSNQERAKKIAKRLNVGTVSINGMGQEYCSPFGGWKQSGNGREWGRFGLHDYLDYKCINA